MSEKFISQQTATEYTLSAMRVVPPMPKRPNESDAAAWMRAVTEEAMRQHARDVEAACHAHLPLLYRSGMLEGRG